MTQTRNERRKHPRVPVRIRIQYRVADQFFTDYIQNLSLGGIFVETTDPLPVHTALKVQFSLPSLEEPIVADGVVVHRVEISGGKAGLRAEWGFGSPSLTNEASAPWKHTSKNSGPLPRLTRTEAPGYASARRFPFDRPSAQTPYRFVIGSLRSLPNAFGVILSPGGAWRLLYSLRSTMRMISRTRSLGNPAWTISSALKSFST